MPVALKVFVDNFLLFLALLNPVSKVLVVSILARGKSRRDLLRISLRSTVTAGVILLAFAAAGTLLLVSVFHVDLYSLKVVGGAVLLVAGFRALDRGKFLAADAAGKVEEVSIVPLASPLIAGPATITACISMGSMIGLPTTCAVIAAALTVNLAAMLAAPRIAGVLGRLGLLGPLIRITGMVVMALGVQMALGGIGEWWTSSVAA